MKLSCKVFSLLLLSISFLACNNSKTSEKKETEQVENTQTQSAKHAFVSSVEEIHKKERFLKEDFVSYQITYQFGNLEDELAVKAATDLSIIEISSKNFGKAYYNGSNLMVDAMANMGDREAKRSFQMVYFYHAFFHLDEETYTLSSAEMTTFMEQKFKQIQVTNQAFHTAFFPTEITFLIEDRTNMMKGLALETSLLGNGRSTQNVQLQYDRFITVNHVPVSLSWKFYPEGKFNEEALLGEAQITKIKYYTADKLQLNIPENANVIKNSPIL